MTKEGWEEKLGKVEKKKGDGKKKKEKSDWKILRRPEFPSLD